MDERTPVANPTTTATEIGALPPVGEIPATMHAQVVRPERYGDPATAFVPETVPTPAIGPDEVLVGVMAAGVNYNNVWAARGYPVDQVAVRGKRGEPEDFHIGGSDASGIVYAVGDAVTDWQVGDQVVVHPGVWDADDPWIAAGRDPMIAPSAKIWGYDTNYGSFGQFARVQSHQLMPKADHLSWAEAAAPTLVGTTAYRMLHGWTGNEVLDGDLVLVWGGSGGLGTQASQLVRAAGGRAVAVVSDDERGAFAMKYGAIGYINRSEFTHWGVPPRVDDAEGQKAWSSEARRFGKKLWEIAGSREDPAIVFEHPGAATIPTSVFLCRPGGMIVICAGTTGFDAMVDLRYHWTRQKRLQGSHGTNDTQAYAYNELVRAGAVDPCVGRVVPFTDLPAVHAQMGRGEEVFGNTVVLVGATTPDEGRA
ncbi:crotonyl-CoA carboxylase/reductase [Aeromicrobium sp. YIM 150415]|uniref:crotonyl-CoA carboxylase/reductase n=1 Tax=Aeromicrobium sp. YIM 150415 TaxID=2803912 RepID=UPI00196368E0|nr:crotonyl-CoA carboxylase/reductase [Aeromicrobium sp. YIM 150415]MBM9463042.1 crotonyl-CoA carboxylase/reductase [Aeromicrobium sp. YIM 150415]